MELLVYTLIGVVVAMWAFREIMTERIIRENHLLIKDLHEQLQAKTLQEYKVFKIKEKQIDQEAKLKPVKKKEAPIPVDLAGTY